MPKICYVDNKFSVDSLRMIATSNEIVAAYAEQGFDLTLRQLYYQMVSRAIISNNERSYKNLGGLISDARLAGLIDWDAIVDRTRNVRSNSHWESPDEIVKTCAEQFRINLWDNQDVVPEVWIEKDALVGVIEPICRELDISYFSCRGYNSQSEMWAGAMRLRRHISNGKRVQVFHLGDHDPSGIDMTRDIEDRLKLFCRQTVPVRRLALNMDQIEQYNPPPNPAKVTDSRAVNYMAEHGTESWELDALEPAVIANLIREAVEDGGIRDRDSWDEAVDKQRLGRDLLGRISDNWDEVVEHLGGE